MAGDDESGRGPVPPDHIKRDHPAPAANAGHGLPPDHECDRDDPMYESVGDWWRDHMGRVPIQMAAGLDQQMKRTGMTFAEAYRHLRKTGRIILISNGRARGGRRGRGTE